MVKKRRRSAGNSDSETEAFPRKKSTVDTASSGIVDMEEDLHEVVDAEMTEAEADALEYDNYKKTLQGYLGQTLSINNDQAWQDFWNTFWNFKNTFPDESILNDCRSVLRKYIFEYIAKNHRHPFEFNPQNNDQQDDWYGHNFGVRANWLFVGTRSEDNWYFINGDNLPREDALILLLNHIKSYWHYYEKFITTTHLNAIGIIDKRAADLSEDEKILCAAQMIKDGTWTGSETRETNIIISAFLGQNKDLDELEELSKKFLKSLKLSEAEENKRQQIVVKIPKIIHQEQHAPEDLYVKLTFDVKKEDLGKWFLGYIDSNCTTKNYQQDLERSLDLVNTAKLLELLQNIKENNTAPIKNPNHQYAIKLLSLTVIKKLQEEALEEFEIEGDCEAKLDILSETLQAIEKARENLIAVLPEENSKHIAGLTLPACDFVHFKNKDGQTVGTIIDQLSKEAFTLASETSDIKIKSDDINRKVFQPIFKMSEKLKIGEEENRDYIKNISKKIDNIENIEKKADGKLKYPGSQCKIASEDWKQNKKRYYKELLDSVSPINEKLGLNLSVPILPESFDNNEAIEDSINKFLKESDLIIKAKKKELSDRIAVISKSIKGNLNKIGKTIDITTDYNFEKILRIIVTSNVLKADATLGWDSGVKIDVKIGGQSLKNKIKTLESLVGVLLSQLEVPTQGLNFEQQRDKLKDICAVLFDYDLSKTRRELNETGYKEKPEHLKQSLISVFQGKHEQQKLVSGLARNYEIIQEFKNSTLKKWQEYGVSGYKTHVEELLSTIRKGNKIAGYHQDALTQEEKLLQTDVANMATGDVRKLVFEQEVVGNKRYKHRDKFLIIKDGDGKIHIVSHYGGNRLYKPEDPLPKTKNMATALLTLGIGHFGDVKAVFLPSGEQKALKIVRIGSTNEAKKSEWAHAKEGWDEEEADLLRELQALRDTKQLIVSAKTKSFLRKMIKRKRKLLNIEIDQQVTALEPESQLSPRVTDVSSSSTTTPAMIPKLKLGGLKPLLSQDSSSSRGGSTTSRGALSSERSSILTPRVPKPPKGDKSSTPQPKQITHMAGTADYLLMELSGSNDLRHETVKEWGQITQIEQSSTSELKEPEEELTVEEELIGEATEELTVEEIGPTGRDAPPIQPPIVQIKAANLTKFCEHLLNRAAEASNVLKEFHLNGTHNDFKGANLAINRDGNSEIIDFGTYKKDKKEIVGEELNPIKHGTAMFISPKSLESINRELVEVTGKSLVNGFAGLTEPTNKTNLTLKEYYIKKRLYEVLGGCSVDISSIENIRNIVKMVMQAGDTASVKTNLKLRQGAKPSELSGFNSAHFSVNKYNFQKQGKSTGYSRIQWTTEEEVKVLLQEIQKQVNARSAKFTMGCDESYDVYALMATISGSANRGGYLSQLIYRYGKLNEQDLLNLIGDFDKETVCPIQEYAGEGQGLQLDRMFEILVKSSQLEVGKQQELLTIKQTWEKFRDKILLLQPGYELITAEQVSVAVLEIKRQVMGILNPEAQQVIKDKATTELSATVSPPTTPAELQEQVIAAIEQRNLARLNILLLSKNLSTPQQYLDLLISAINKAAATKNIEALEQLHQNYLEIKKTEPDFTKLVEDTLFDKIFSKISLSVFDMSFYDNPILLSLLIDKKTFDFKLLFKRQSDTSLVPLEILLAGQNKSVWNVVKKALIQSQLNKPIPEKLKFISQFCLYGFPNNFASILVANSDKDPVRAEQILVDLSRLMANVIGTFDGKDNKQEKLLAKIMLLASISIMGLNTNSILQKFPKLQDNLKLTTEEIATIDAIRTVANQPRSTGDIINKLLTVDNIKKFQEGLIDIRLDLWYEDIECTKPILTSDIAYKFFNQDSYKLQVNALLEHKKHKLFKRIFDVISRVELNNLKPKIPELIITALQKDNKEIIKYILDKYSYDSDFLETLTGYLSKQSLPESQRKIISSLAGRFSEKRQNLAEILQFTIKDCVKRNLDAQPDSTKIDCYTSVIQSIHDSLENDILNKLYTPIRHEMMSYQRIKPKPLNHPFSKSLLQIIQQQKDSKNFYNLLCNNSLKQNIAKFFPTGAPTDQFNLDYYGLEAINSLLESAEKISVEQFDESIKNQFIQELLIAQKSLKTAMAIADQLKTILADVTKIMKESPPAGPDYNIFIKNQIKLCNDFPHKIQAIFSRI